MNKRNQSLNDQVSYDGSNQKDILYNNERIEELRSSLPAYVGTLLNLFHSDSKKDKKLGRKGLINCSKDMNEEQAPMFGELIFRTDLKDFYTQSHIDKDVVRRLNIAHQKFSEIGPANLKKWKPLDEGTYMLLEKACHVKSKTL